MFRSAARSALRRSVLAARPTANHRFASTAPPHAQSRSWRNLTVRCAIAVAGIYYYNTSTVFADEPALLEEPSNAENPSLPTLSSLSPSSRFRPPTPEEKPTIPIQPSSSSPPSLDPKAPSPAYTDTSPELSNPSALEQEAGQQGAFNEETGEINWDCPCLGGMAHGPCGEEFRAAFSCFVYSTEEPKGMDCIEKFKGMQNCFRQHPEVYGEELQDEDDEAQALGTGEEAAVAAASLPEDTPHVAAAGGTMAKEKAAAPEAEITVPLSTATSAAEAVGGAPTPIAQKRSMYDAEDVRVSEPSGDVHDVGKQDKLLKDHTRSRNTTRSDAGLEEDELVPRASHDATTANNK